MTGLLNGLRKQGLIERQIHPEDRRKVGVRLTDRGHRTLDKVLPDYYHRFAKLTTYLDEGERQTLISLLKKVNQGLSSVVKK